MILPPWCNFDILFSEVKVWSRHPNSALLWRRALHSPGEEREHSGEARVSDEQYPSASTVAGMLTLVVLELLYLSSGELESGIDIISTCLSQTLPTSHHNIVSSQGILTIDFLLISATCRPRCQPRPWLPSPTTPPTWPTWRQPTDRLSKIDAPRGISLTNISFCIATLCQHSEQIKQFFLSRTPLFPCYFYRFTFRPNCFTEDGERLKSCPSRPADSQKFTTCTIAVYDVESRKL